MHDYAKLLKITLLTPSGFNNSKQNRSLCQILSFMQSFMPSDFTYCVKFADCQLRTYERNLSCYYFRYQTYKGKQNFTF